MTTLQDKTPEELNVMCAELCGWHHIHNDGPELVVGHRRWQNEPDVDAEPLPAYATSYDAIMPEVQRVWKDRPATVTSILAKIVGSSEEDCLFFASPADLTRALILTLTK